MDGWQPLAPTKRASGMYARANPGPSSNLKPSQKTIREDSEHSAKEERRAAILQGPSDPFPPVGPFPHSVAVRILSFLNLAEQKNCALAGRSLARAVADESNWSRRLDALDWCTVDGISVGNTEEQKEESLEREIGRRRKGKRKDETKVGEQEKSVERHSVDQAKSHKEPSSVPTSGASNGFTDDDDEFGDFSGPSTNKDGFGEFNFDKLQIAGGSLASGMASVAMGGGRPHDFSSSGAPSFTPLSPIKDSKHGQSLNIPQKNGAIFSYSSETTLPLCSASASFRRLRSYAKALRPFIKSLADPSGPPTNSLIFTCDLGLSAQTALLSNLLRFISTSVGGGPSNKSKRQSLIHGYEEQDSIISRGQEAAHRLLQNLLSSFEGILARRGDAIRASSHGADTSRAVRRAEDDMRLHASGVWELGNARLALALSDGEDFENELEDQFGRMQAAKIFLEKCEILTERSIKHDPLANISNHQQNGTVLDFTAMDTFIGDVLEVVKKDGEIIARIFPPEQDVLLAYADRVAEDVIGKYIKVLLEHTQNIPSHLYLRSCAATFAQAWKLVDALQSIEPKEETIVTLTRCEDVVFHLWENNMNDYLSTENLWVRQEMQAVTDKWDSDLKNEDPIARVQASFIGSQNPAAVKRSVLSGFKDVLLLPVTVVPRTAGIVGGAVIRTAGTGLSTLNPLRWQSGGATSGQKAANSLGSDLVKTNGVGSTSTSSLPRTPVEANEKGYMDFSNGTIGTMDDDSDSDAGEEDDRDDLNDVDEWNQEVAVWSAVASSRPSEKKKNMAKPKKAPLPLSSPSASLSTQASTLPTNMASIHSSTTSRAGTPIPSSQTTLKEMQLLLSLDTALQVIHVNRDCLKRIETFKRYPHPYGDKVHEAIRDVSLLLFRALGDGHISSGFEKAIKQIQEWKPEEHSTGEKDGEQQQVEPLVHFFELVHVGDTIAQMVQVYFDQEMSRHIDKNDFLDPVVKGRKKFEGNLDEAVARGMNAGVDLLLGQAEHIITTQQQPQDYNPPIGHLPDLSPTKACRETVDCLKLHCKMLVGAADKNVLEVFYQEVGIRLHAIICKHLKKQLISLDGGFRVIADLNEYHSFVAETLRQPILTADFDSLKMLGNLYIIDNPKELAKLARDANMFGGSVSPEDLYEFLQARADFRFIEKAIDKEMYGFKVSEDCCIC